MIAVDAMGGDHAPHLIIKGAYAAACKGIAVILYGPLQELDSELTKLDQNWRSKPLTVVDAPEVIGMGEEPVQAIRKKRLSSLVQAVESVKSGRCRAVVSAGSSGALMAAAALLLGRKPGIERPAILGFLPSKRGSVICLDLGANIDCKPQYLLQFAQLGVEHAQELLKIENPSVGLLANGTENSKGNVLTKEAYVLLERSGLNFVGNVEPGDIIDHTVDVVVADGFVGNIMLKTMESTAAFFQSIAAEYLTSLMAADNKAVHAQAVHGYTDKLRTLVSATEQGGALLAGVNGVVIVAHGNSNDKAVEKAIIYANRHARPCNPPSETEQTAFAAAR